MKLFYTDHFDLPLPVGHRFPMDKYRLTRERLASDRSRSYELLVPHAATDAELLLAHDAEYLRKMKVGELQPVEEKRIGFPWSEALVLRSRYSTGATICAARAAIKDKVAANLAGGTHHAFADTAAGYCVFNDAVVAARVLQQESVVGQVAIVDCDVHQGNGSAAITAEDASIFTLSIHGEKNYPFRKTQSDLDIALPDGTEDDEYLTALERGLDFVWSQGTPDIVFYIAGADPFARDRLGRLRISKAGLASRDQMVMDRAHRAGVPVAISMGGGYANVINDIVDIHVATVESAFDTVFCAPS